MNQKLYKTVTVLAAAIAVISSVLSVGSTTFANTQAAKAKPPKPTVAATAMPAAPNAPVALTIRQLNERVAVLPQMASSVDGEIVTISDDGSQTGLIWQGTYVFHPAGSPVQLGDMYARWKDGLIAIQKNIAKGKADGKYLASFIVPGGKADKSVLLIQDPKDASVLRVTDNA